MEGSDFLLAGVLFLFAAVAAVPLASRLGIGAVLGYLLAGIAIGPWGLGFISDVDEILHFSELGVVFLMFIIGLELNPSKLWQLRRSIFGVGAAQVLLSAALLAGLLMLTDFAWQAAVVGGIGLAMSSTEEAKLTLEPTSGVSGGTKVLIICEKGTSRFILMHSRPITRCSRLRIAIVRDFINTPLLARVK